LAESGRRLRICRGLIGVDALTDYYARELKEANVDAIGDDVNFEFVELDLAVDTLEPLLAGVDEVFHLGAHPGVLGGDVCPLRPRQHRPCAYR
jgi:nucleoside-diphosphate-sugar epimerase